MPCPAFGSMLDPEMDTSSAAVKLLPESRKDAVAEGQRTLVLNKAADPMCQAWQDPLRLDILEENCRADEKQAGGGADAFYE